MYAIRGFLPMVLIAFLFTALPAKRAGAQIDNSGWTDRGIVYSAPAGSAYYPSVLFDQDGFRGESPRYRMWYSDGAGGAFVAGSGDGVS